MKRKLAGFGLAFAMAELAAAYLPPLVCILTAALFVAGLLLWQKRRCLPVMLGILTGVAYALLFAALTALPVQRWAGRTVSCVAVVETDCETSYLDGMQRGTLSITEIEGNPVHLKVYCMAFPGEAPGNRFTAQFTFSELEDNSYRMSRLARGIAMEAVCEGDFCRLDDSASPKFVLYRLRKALSGKLSYWLPRQLGGIESAMLLGDKTSLAEEDRLAFSSAGVSHLLAVSGLHVSLLCGVLGAGTRRKRRFYRPAVVARALLVLFYMFLTGMPVSVVRAGSVFLLALLGDFLLQPADLLTSTGVAAVGMGLLNAYAPCDIGFQLSFCAVLGVQLAAALSKWEHAQRRLPAPLLALFDTVQCAAFASLATLPVLIAHQLTVSGAGVLCNLLVVWMLQPALMMGLLVLALSLVPALAPAFHLASLVLAVWLKWMVAVVRWCASLPFAKLCLPRRYTLWVLAVLGLLALLFYAAKRIRWYPLAMAACTAVAVAAGIGMSRDVVRIAMVGTAGNPCAVVTQNGEAVVFFRGGNSNLLAVEEYLAAQGDPEWTLLVDLRQNPREMAFPAECVVELDALDEDRQETILSGVTLDLTHTGSANLAVLGVGGYHLAFPAGSIRLPQPIQVDVLCAAGSYSQSIAAGAIVYTARKPAWLNKTKGETLYYGGETPVIVIRPGRSMTFEEVTRIVVQ